MKLFNTIPSFLRNKYFFTAGLFVLWMLFFDRNDIFTTIERKQQLRQMEQSKEYYTKEIATNKKFAADLKSDPSTIEKFAREKYLMKRDNEDLFLIKRVETE
ncbi:MAG TPA: septum formation initiator family protein [Flavisolibacter sp.]|nr:septum formation initiator family protein [Flavisolibacter sp.]